MPRSKTTEQPRKKRAECAVVAIITDRHGRVLMTQRDREPKAGIWHMPGGGVEFGEGHIAALVREVQEEVGVDIVVTDQRPQFTASTLYPDVDRHVVAIYFAAVVARGKPRALDATRKVMWTNERQAKGLLKKGLLLDSCRRALVATLGWTLPAEE